MVRTHDFDSCSPGSNPGSPTILIYHSMKRKLKIIWNLLFAKQYFYASSENDVNSKEITSEKSVMYTSECIPPFFSTVKEMATKLYKQSRKDFEVKGSIIPSYSEAYRLLSKGVILYLTILDGHGNPTTVVSYKFRSGLLIETNDKGQMTHITFDKFRKIWEESVSNNMTFFKKYWKHK